MGNGIMASDLVVLIVYQAWKERKEINASSQLFSCHCHLPENPELVMF